MLGLYVVTESCGEGYSLLSVCRSLSGVTDSMMIFAWVVFFKVNQKTFGGWGRFWFCSVPHYCFLFWFVGLNCLLVSCLRVPYGTFDKTFTLFLFGEMFKA